MKKIGIYKITSPSERVYIGQSIDIERRLKSYKNQNCHKQVRLLASFNKHGYDNHTFEVIEECEFIELNNRERYWQEHYDVLSKKGLNCALVNTDTLPLKRSEETKEKIRQSSFGKKHTEETKRKLSEIQKGKIILQSTREKISAKLMGVKKKPLSEETKEKLRQINLGKKHSEESLEKRRTALIGRKRPQYVIDKIYKTKVEKGLIDPFKKNRVKNPIGGVISSVFINLETGIFYFGYPEASQSTIFSKSSFTHQVNGRMKNKTKMIKL